MELGPWNGVAQGRPSFIEEDGPGVQHPDDMPISAGCLRFLLSQGMGHLDGLGHQAFLHVVVGTDYTSPSTP